MVDTNILLDWLLARDPERTQLIDALFAKSKEILISDLVLAELVFALEKYYELPRELVAQNLVKVLDEALFKCNRPVFYASLVAYREHAALSFIDCYLVAYAESQNDLPLWSFDKKLVKLSQGKARLLGLAIPLHFV